jgi:hypothetical protein
MINYLPVQTGLKFDAAWLRAPDYRDTLERAWSDASTGPKSLHSTWASLNSVAVFLEGVILFAVTEFLGTGS